jgi:HAD superfamily hydrolase (TIGR01509 family)
VSDPRAVIFDMDGVMVDSEPRHEQAFLEVLEAIGYRDTHGLNFADYLGRTDKELWEDFVTRHDPPQTVDELARMKCQRVIEIIRRDQPLFEGLPDLVEKLAGKYALGLASGSDRLLIEEVLSLGDLRRYFGAAVSASEVPQGKPAPDVFLHTARLLRVPARNCWVVEDSKPGVAAGLAAGMRVIAITNTHPAEELRNATHVVRTYEEIQQLLLGTDER